VLIDPNTGQTATYHPDLYDAEGQLRATALDAAKLEATPHALPHLPRPRWHQRVARFVRRQVIGI
jgi:hypothetical protein